MITWSLSHEPSLAQKSTDHGGTVVRGGGEWWWGMVVLMIMTIPVPRTARADRPLTDKSTAWG